MAKSLRPPPPDPESRTSRRPAIAKEIGTQLQRLKWFCWHGNVSRALQTIDDLIFDLDITEPDPEQARLLKAAASSMHRRALISGLFAAAGARRTPAHRPRRR